MSSTDDSAAIVGLQFSLYGRVTASWKLRETFRLGKTTTSELTVNCEQISCHQSNDNKQINILTGQGSCSVGFPMSCCMVSKHNLGDPPEWIQRRTIRESIKTSSVAVNPVIPPSHRHRFDQELRASMQVSFFEITFRWIF